MMYCGPLVRTYIEKATEIATRYTDPVEMIPEYYDKMLVPDGWAGPIRNDPELRSRIKTERWSFACHPLECVPVSLGMFYASRGDVMRTIVGAVNFGRDCDTIAAIGGALAGRCREHGASTWRWSRRSNRPLV